MTENERKRMLVQMRQLESHGLLFNFIASLASSENKKKSPQDTEKCKEMAKKMLECFDDLQLVGQRGIDLKKMLTNTAKGKEPDFENNNEK